MKKKKISRILGVVLSLALLSSMAILPAPVSAGTQVWSATATPSATGLVMDPGNTWAGPFARTITGSAIYAGTDVTGTAPAVGDTLVRSTDGGRTWVAMTGLPILTGAGRITDIVTSSIDANTVYVTDGNNIWKTTTGDATQPTWSSITNLFASVATATGTIVSIDVGYLGTNPYIFAATTRKGAAAGNGGAYVNEEAVFGTPWSDLLINSDRPVTWGVAAGTVDVLDIQVDPASFATTQMVMALATNYSALNGGPATVITTKYGGAQWDATVNDESLPGVAASVLQYGSMWLPDDFSSSRATGLMRVFAGVATDNIAGTGLGDVFLASFDAPAAAPSAATDLNIRGAATTTEVTSLGGTGAGASAVLMASGFDRSTAATSVVPLVYRSTAGGYTWLKHTKGPTGGATPFVYNGVNPAVSHLLVIDSTTALIGTQGAAGADNAVSLSIDGGKIWNAVSLVNETNASIDDLELSPNLFMAVSGASNDSIWRLDGTQWTRVFSGSTFANATTTYSVQETPAGDAMFAADIGGTTIWRSADNGETWTAQTNAVPGAISDFVVIDANNLIVGGPANTVYTTATNGGFWFTVAVAAGTIQDLAYDQGTGHLLVGGTANIFRSINSGVAWTAVTTPLTAPITATSLAFSNSYATDDMFYASGNDATANAGVWSYDYDLNAAGTVIGWSTARIDGGGNTADVNAATGMVTTSGGGSNNMIYVADAALAEGVSRIRAPRTTAEGMQDAVSAVSTLNGLWSEGNVLYSIDTTPAADRILTFTDTLAANGTGVVVSAVTPTTATVTWTDMSATIALTYSVFVHTTAQTDLYTAANVAGIVAPAVTSTTNTALLTGLSANTTYHVSVWANNTATQVSSFIFDGAATSFATLPGAVAAVPLNLVPISGAVNVPVSGPAFAWAAPAGGATSYTWELSTNPLFLTDVVTETLTVPYMVYSGTLEYETAYYWRVTANTAAGAGAAVTSVFTTVAAPVVEPPAEPQPTPVITVEIPDDLINTLTELPDDLADMIPEIPDIVVPDIDVEIPDIQLPELVIPEIELPEITLPEIELPEITLPEIEIPDFEIPEIVIPDIEIPPLEQPDVIVNLPQPTVTTVTSTIEAPPTPAYVWAVVAIGAILTIAVIILIIRTRRIV